MSDRTGMARGNLRPILYYEDASGHIVLAAHDAGDPAQARRMYQEVYKPKGYAWREASSWPEWERLQKRLIDQEARRMEFYRDRLMTNYDTAAKLVRDAMYQRMVSTLCSNYEREFIQGWLALKEEKRSKYEQLWREHHNYLWAVEQDSGKKIDEAMKGENAL
jgi:hypothetical protein